MNFLRKLSPIEHLACLLGQDEPLDFAMTARIRGPLTQGLLEDALSKAVAKHPLAGARIVEGPKGERWLATDPAAGVPLSVVPSESEEDWADFLSTELARLTDGFEEPLVRFVWLRREGASEVIALCHHAIADGLSAAYLMRDVVDFLNHPGSAVEPLPLLPPIEELIPARLQALLTLRIVGEFKEKAGKISRQPAPAPDAATAPPSYRLLYRTLTIEETRALAEAARSHATTVHGILGAAFLQAAAGSARSEGSRRILQSPVSLRGMLSRPVDNGFGFYVNQVKTYVDCPPGGDTWEIATDLKSELDSQAKPENALYSVVQIIQLVRLGVRPETMYRMRGGVMNGDEKEDFTLSNIGRLEIEAGSGPFEVECLYGPTFSAMQRGRVVGVCTLNGRLTLTFMHDSNDLHAEAADQLLDSGLEYLRAAVESRSAS